MSVLCQELPISISVKIKSMKDNKLIIKIKKSSEEVFAYYTNPNNTPLWWDAVAKEETSEWPRKAWDYLS